MIDRNGTCFSFAGRGAEGIARTIENVIAIAARISTCDELERKENGAVDVHIVFHIALFLWILSIATHVRVQSFKNNFDIFQKILFHTFYLIFDQSEIYYLLIL